MPRWESNSYLKIHEGCGGLVRWVEAYDDPHTGYTGECVECGAEGIVVEEILPMELPDDMIATDAYNELDIADLRDFEWDYDADYSTQQAQLRELMDA